MAQGVGVGFFVVLGVLSLLELGLVLGWLYHRKRERLIDETPRSAVRDLMTGLAEVVGRATTLDGTKPLRSPWKGTPCVYYHLKVQEYRGGHRDRRWVTVINDRSSEPFGLDDGGDVAQVDPDGATLTLREDGRIETGLFQGVS